MMERYPTRTGIIPTVTAFCALALGTGCAGPASQAGSAARPAEWPAFEPASAGETVYRIDRQASLLMVRVDPAGPMARLGHSHIIGGPVLSGSVVAGPDPADARVDLTIDVASLAVDRPRWRQWFGLDPEIPREAIEDTRANMLGERVLDAAAHPEIRVRSAGLRGPAWMPDIGVRIRWRGAVRETVVPVAVFRDGPDLVATGRFDLHQRDFGIEPFSTAGGALRVADRIRIRFHIVASAAGLHPSSRSGSASMNDSSKQPDPRG